MASIRALIDKLDVPMQGSAATGNIWVVYLKNADAVKLATVLRAAFSAGGGGGGGGGGRRRRRDAAPAAPLGANPAGTAAPDSGASTAATAPVTPSAAPSTGGFIQADPSTNSLIITAPEPLYRQVRAMIDQLDARRAQVYIESMIVEVDAAPTTADFGFQWQGLLGSKSDNNIVVGGTNFGHRRQRQHQHIVPLAVGIAGGRTAAAARCATLPSGLQHRPGAATTAASTALGGDRPLPADAGRTPTSPRRRTW